MNLLRREPQDLFNRFDGGFQQLFNRLSEQWPTLWDEDSRIVTSEWSPSVDFREEDDQFVLNADIPGVDPEDIEVSMDGGTLSIKGERTAMDKNSSNGYRRVECRHGAFHRRFSLPDSADPENIEARDKHGVLTITIGKRELAKPKMISIKS